MKTTVDLPADLVHRVKLQALKDGRKLKETMAELLRRGLAEKKKPTGEGRRVKLPLIRCRRSADLSPERIANILSEQEARWVHEAS